MKLSEWNRNSTTIKLGNSTFRFQSKVLIILTLLVVLFIFYILYPSLFPSSSNDIISSIPIGSHPPSSPVIIGGKRGSLSFSRGRVGEIYPKTEAVSTERGLKYRIGMIADLDKESKTGSGKWISYLRRGSLYVQFNLNSPQLSKVSVEWDNVDPTVVKSGLNLDGRGMELSELVSYKNKILSCDDRTGIIYILNTDLNDGEEIDPVPWIILPDGNGSVSKGFKCEWACVKEDYLYVGGLGKEWTTSTGELINTNPQFIKRISGKGEVDHLDWKGNYNKMSQALNIHFPGYVIHESGGWSEIFQKWVFMPRRASTEQYNEKTDEEKGTNVLLLADENFNNVEVRHVGDVKKTHGFSSFKFIPSTQDQLIIALKSEEHLGTTGTYLMVFTIDGHVLLGEEKVGDHKYEGIEFI